VRCRATPRRGAADAGVSPKMPSPTIHSYASLIKSTSRSKCHATLNFPTFCSLCLSLSLCSASERRLPSSSPILALVRIHFGSLSLSLFLSSLAPSQRPFSSFSGELVRRRRDATRRDATRRGVARLFLAAVSLFMGSTPRHGRGTKPPGTHTCDRQRIGLESRERADVACVNRRADASLRRAGIPRGIFIASPE